MLKGPIDEVEIKAKPFCRCWDGDDYDVSNRPDCRCGENIRNELWSWLLPDSNIATSYRISSDQKEVTFHPFSSSGTAVIKANRPLMPNYDYYWEIKMLSKPYGTDIMVGVGSDKVDIYDSIYNFRSFLGHNEESYGLSYTGRMSHDNTVYKDGRGFCQGTIIGVRVDYFQGTLEFYINGIPQGILFRGLRKHKLLYPMMCSTAQKSTLRLINTAAWKSSLLVSAARVLASTGCAMACLDNAPPGMKSTIESMFWMMRRSESAYMVLDDFDSFTCPHSCGMNRRGWKRRW